MQGQDEQLFVALDTAWKVISREMKTAIEKGLIAGEGAHTRMMELTDALREVDITIGTSVRNGLAHAAKLKAEQAPLKETK